MDLERTGKFIAECRKVQNLTQKQLADKLGINDKTISKWERGVNAPDISLLIPLAKCLDVEVQEILKGKKRNKVIKKNSELIIIVTIIFLIVITLVSSFCFDKYVDSKDVILYSLESTNKDYYVKGFIAVNQEDYVISISKIDYINKSGGNNNEHELKETEIKILNNEDVLYSVKKIKDNNGNKDLYLSNFLKTINFTVTDDKEKININNLNLEIMINYKEIENKYTPISIKLILKK